MISVHSRKKKAIMGCNSSTIVISGPSVKFAEEKLGRGRGRRNRYLTANIQAVLYNVHVPTLGGCIW